jgi:hypothetical protein
MSTSLEQTVETSRSRFAHFPRSDVEQSIPARFERQARMYPDRIALDDPETALTYRDLNRLANPILDEDQRRGRLHAPVPHNAETAHPELRSKPARNGVNRLGTARIAKPDSTLSLNCLRTRPD